MSKAYKIFIWKKAPFIRLLVPVIVGILIQYYSPLAVVTILLAAGIFFAALSIFLFTPLVFRFKFPAISGALISGCLVCIGTFLTWNKDIRNHDKWYGHRYDTSSYGVATIIEPLIEKPKSYKALVNVESITNNDSVYATSGKLLVYFEKDSGITNLQYGSRIIFKKQLQLIKNSGNPAAFNYNRYCAFQQIFHQCYLKKNEWETLSGRNAKYYKDIIFKSQQVIVKTLDDYITGKQESALAKALLIGYKIDLDKDLVQAYTNAGVVHLIAISGMHLALIYALLFFITSKLPIINKSGLGSLVFILFGLWFFSLLTGGSGSVLRAAVMFSFIAVGNAFNKNASIYNSLAASAFVLLCYDPFMLWDVGFQLSYLAVLGIVVSHRYIYNWFYFKNKILNEIWKLASVSLSAQIFTLPICLYYFHQLPLLFLLGNIVAIPLSTLALWGCIILIAIAPLPWLALYFGKAVSVVIWLLNHSVILINKFPFLLWDDISISVSETILLYIIFIAFMYWLMQKNQLAFRIGLYSSLAFALLIAIDKWQFYQQEKLIVYNVPAHKAIDFVHGNAYHFIGDTDLMANSALQNFHLKPSRISFMLREQNNEPAIFFQHGNFYAHHGKKILMIDSAIDYKPRSERIKVDYIVVSKNPKLIIPSLAKAFNCNLYIFDASNPLWKIDKWKKDCEELHLHFHSVPEQGAFITDL
jgi:competence protein ComEC